MKFIYLLFLLNSAFANTISFYENENVTICEPPSSVTQVAHISGSPYFLNYGEEWPRNYFTVLVWERDISNLEIEPSTYFYSNDVCINGNVSFYNGNPQITLKNFSQIIPVAKIENIDSIIYKDR